MHDRAVRRSGMELGLACMVTGALLPIEKVTAAHIVGTSDPAQYSYMLDNLGLTHWDIRNGMLFAGWFTSRVACFSEPFTCITAQHRTACLLS